jgi:diaminopimelate decarboxylase
VRSDLTAAVALAIERSDQPSLIFDAARIDANASAIARGARAAGITVLFAAKSFPHPEARRVALRHFDGFDAASEAELAELPPARIVSIADPTGRAGATAHLTSQRVIVGCETIEQVRAAPAHAEIAIRISASLTNRDPAIGVVQGGSGHRRSRFGLDVDPARRAALVRDFVAAAAGRPVGLHVHHGPVTAVSSERFVATARALLATAAAAELAPRFMNLGGAWHAIADLDLALREVRDAVPRDIEVIVEPGRALSDGAGFACGRVTVARELDDRALRVVDLSRICHLRWSHVELVGAAPRANLGRHVLIAGPTCFEDDVIGEWIVEDELPIGARVTVRHVTGYAIAWNTGFHGVPPADVVVV